MSKAATATARGRTGTPVEVAQAALPPASGAASFGNGAHLFVEKGFVAGGETNTSIHFAATRRYHDPVTSVDPGVY